MSFWQSVVTAVAGGGGLLNRAAINHFASTTPPRPHRFSLWSPTRPAAAPHVSSAPAGAPLEAPASFQSSSSTCYTTWPSLFDRGFTARHLPGRTDGRVYPAIDDVVGLLVRDSTAPMRLSESSSFLFCFFAQWFTDSFLRKDPVDPRRNTSNHEIDLCQIYGLDEPSTWALRLGQGGLLKSRQLNGEEYPPLLYSNGQIDPQFYGPTENDGLSFLRAGRAAIWEAGINGSLTDVLNDPNRRDYFYASGLDRAGSTVAYSAFNIIFLREHNQIARAIAAVHPNWDDDRVFETARMVNIRQVLTVVVDDYIRHISGNVFPLELETGFAGKEPWYRTNRIAMEFDLLYRWHSIIPDALVVNGTSIPAVSYRFNNKLLEETGIETLISAASVQKAGRYGLFNTPDFMHGAEIGGLQWARQFGVQPFNRYRERFGLEPYKTIDDLTHGDADATKALTAVYGTDVNAVEFSIGLVAEGRDAGSLMPETVTRMVAFNAFTHIFTNPLLADEVHVEDTFSDVGWALIQQKSTLADIVSRNVSRAVTVSLAA